MCQMGQLPKFITENDYFNAFIFLYFSDTDSQTASSATAAGGSSTANGNVAAGSRAAEDVEKVAEGVTKTAQATSEPDVDGNSDGNANNCPSDAFTGVASNGQNENIPSKSIK